MLLDIDKYQNPDWDEPLAPGSYVHALVLDVRQAAATVKFGRLKATLGPADIAWTTHKLPDEILARGDIAYVKVVSL